MAASALVPDVVGGRTEGGEGYFDASSSTCWRNPEKRQQAAFLFPTSPTEQPSAPEATEPTSFQDACDSLSPPHKYNHASTTTCCWRIPEERPQQAAFFPTLPTESENESENESKIEVENNENKSGVESASPSALK